MLTNFTAQNLGRSGSNKSGVSNFSNYLPVAPSGSSAMSAYMNGEQNAVAGPSRGYAKGHAGADVVRGNSLSSFQSLGSGNSASSRVDDIPYEMGIPGPSRMDRFNERNNRERQLDEFKRQLALHDAEYDSEEEFDEVEEEDRFVNLALLSHLAVRLRDKVPRGTHVKGGIPYSRAFTGRDVVVRTDFRVSL